MPTISETELNAYVDGEAFPERQAIIEAWLARNPAQAAQVQAWRRQNQVLRATFGRILAEPPPADLIRASFPQPVAERRRPLQIQTPVQGQNPRPKLRDCRDRLALIAAGSFLAGASVACLAGYWLG
jgi:anti-sigma factor RsiW